MMNFGDALNHLKFDGKAARRGWNDKNMFIYLENGSAPGDTQVEPTSWGMDLISGVDKDHFDTGAEGTTVRLPHINLRAANGTIIPGWLASQNDMLAEDWVEVL
jgi:hypothetical protein